MMHWLAEDLPLVSAAEAGYLLSGVFVTIK